MGNPDESMTKWNHIRGVDVVWSQPYVKSLRIAWIEHLVTMDEIRMVKIIFEWSPTGNRIRG